MIGHEARRRVISVVACGSLMLLAPRNGHAEPETVSINGSVVDADGKPVTGAELFFGPATFWPGGDKWESPPTKSDAEGRFQLSLPRVADNGRKIHPGTLWAFKPGRLLARQKLSDMPPGTSPSPVQLVLGPPSTFHMKVLSPEGKPVAGAEVTVSELLPAGQTDRSAQTQRESLPVALQLRMAATSDDEGAAIVSAVLPEEVATVEIKSPQFGRQSYHWYQSPPDDKSVKLAPMGRVRGRVVADKPDVSGNIPVTIVTAGDSSGLARFAYAAPVTDDQGRFKASIAEGEQLYVRLPDEPKPSYLCPIKDEVRSLRAGQTVEVELQIVPAVLVRGVVRERGTGDRVPKMGVRYESRAGTIDWAEPDAAGRFELYRGAGTLEFHVACSEPTVMHAWFCPHYVVIPSGVKEFELAPIELCHARGRVIDETGKPVAGVKIDGVQCKTDRDWPTGPQEFGYTASAGPDCAVCTDAEGRFDVWVETSQRWRLPIRAEGMLPMETDWIDFSATAVIPDIVLHRIQLHAVAGRAVDRQRRPVAEATVFQTGSGPKRTEAATDSDGKFHIEGIMDENAFVFVRKPGFRFSGRMAQGSADNLELVLARADEPTDRPLHALPLLLTRAERLVMAKRVLAPVVKQALANDDENARGDLLMVLAKVEPERVLQSLEEKPIKEPFAQGFIRRAVARELFKESPDEARTVAESIAEPFFRSETYLDFCDALPAGEKQRKLELVGQALLQLQGITTPWMRVMSHAEIAKRLLDLGQQDRAAKLLRDGQTAAKALATVDLDGYARGSFAERLSAVDLPAALELIKDLSIDQGDSCRHHGNIAHIVAGTNPAEAERILGLMRNNSNETGSDQYASRVCYRMAPVDLERAKRIAAGVTDPYQKAQAHAVMAQALAKAQPTVARELLSQAFDVLEESIKDGKDHFDGQHDPSTVAAAFLPVVEQIDPQLVDEFLWRAIALRQNGLNRNQQNNPSPLDGGSQASSDMRLAMVLARYDRTLADALFASFWKRIPGALSGRGDTGGIVTAAAVLDPKQAVAIIEGLPDGDAKTNAARRLAKFLALDDDKCWNYIQREVLVLWVVDEEDFGADE